MSSEPRFAQLSPRHRDCLRLAHRRFTTKEIARELGIAPGTAATYCTEAIALLGADDRRHAAQLLHDQETPSQWGAPSVGVGDDVVPPPSAAPAGQPAHFLGPLAPANRDADNDASITSRITWVILLAVALAVGFGSIVAAVHTISDVVVAQRRPPRQ